MPRKLKCGRFSLQLGNSPLIMGILNVTPDSFSDGGRFVSVRSAVARARRMEAEGADLIDIGGESTRPGARAVSIQTEIKRVVPVIERLNGKLKIPISVDTAKPEVAQAACQAGAALINDITALRDSRMAEVVQEARVPVILMHMRGLPRTMQRQIHFGNVIAEVKRELKTAAARGMTLGIGRDQILVDPGIGFGKKLEQNLRLIQSMESIRSLGFPVVIGPSRKSFIGSLLDQPVEERLMGTAAAVALSVAQGADMIRVHDVAQMRQVALVAHAIAQARSPR